MAPDFVLPNQDGRQVSLGDLLGGGLVLYFYPADFTPGCTAEACHFRERHEELLAAGLTLAGISPQGVASHARFRDQHHLPFDLLSDPERDVVRAYDALGPFGLGVRRITYLVEPDGRIADAVLADVRVGRHFRFVAEVIARRTPR